MKKVLIIDDEEPARKKIEHLLSNFPELRLVDVARNGLEAVSKIDAFRPDLIFLDIQMPDFNGFEVLSKINHSPFIIFTTAYDQFAIKAFEVNAVDYLLKPFDEERFEKSVNNAIDQIGLRQKSQFEKKLMQLLHDYQHVQGDDLDILTIRDRGRNIHVPIPTIQYVEANGNYLSIHTKNQVHLYRSTMNGLEEKLNKTFLRIHRSFIVNKDFVARCSYRNNNEYTFLMQNGSKITSGRMYKDAIDLEMF